MLSVYVTTKTEEAPFKTPKGWMLDHSETQGDGHTTVWRYDVDETESARKRDTRFFLTFAYATEMIESFQIY